MKAKMGFLLALGFIFMFFGPCTSQPTELPKPKAVHLAHSCMRVISGDVKPKDNTPILLFHGLANVKEVWSGIYQVLALRTGRRVCIADLRNHGDSPWSDEFEVRAMAEDISLLLDTLNEPKAIILGHSIGGRTSLFFALNNPNKVEKLIVEDMRPSNIPPEANKGVQIYMGLLKGALQSVKEGSSDSEARAQILDFINEDLKKTNSKLWTESDLALVLRCSGGNCQWKMNSKLIDAVEEDPNRLMTENSGTFEGPSLFVYGKASPFKVWEAESDILQFFPKAQFHGIEGGGHVVHNNPEFLDVVLKFINGNEDI